MLGPWAMSDSSDSRPDEQHEGGEQENGQHGRDDRKALGIFAPLLRRGHERQRCVDSFLGFARELAAGGQNFTPAGCILHDSDDQIGIKNPQTQLAGLPVQRIAFLDPQQRSGATLDGCCDGGCENQAGIAIKQRLPGDA